MHNETQGHRRLTAVLITAALSCSFSAFAGSGYIPSDHDAYPSGVTSIPAVAAQCFACHGPNGQAVYDDWPSLAGQKQAYLLKQLEDFKSGARKHPMMAPIVANLSDADIKTLAAYMSAQAPAQPRPESGAGQTAKAPASAAACMACHDNAALPDAPFLHGQRPVYLAAQIHAFKTGARKNPTMQAMVQSLSDQDIDALARYFSSLPPLAPGKK
ncbi:c-type cytochrome [uncultured Castellaniella sp.]|uniref:c-type cytochrome n=1 Tax=uncultured Castellaniella sp. TaxID=647907 RepID=UPI0026057E6F|nr:c-type cytochrome [uncultured Castellaniella sp.]